jgi:hypothetical protein
MHVDVIFTTMNIYKHSIRVLIVNLGKMMMRKVVVITFASLDAVSEVDFYS